jgi:hypothetical protein
MVTTNSSLTRRRPQESVSSGPGRPPHPRARTPSACEQNNSTSEKGIMTKSLIRTPFGAQSTAADVVAGIDLTGRRAIVTGLRLSPGLM